MPVAGRFIDRDDLFSVELIPANRIEKSSDGFRWPLSTIGDLWRAAEPCGPVAVQLFNDDVSEGTHGYFEGFRFGFAMPSSRRRW